MIGTQHVLRINYVNKCGFWFRLNAFAVEIGSKYDMFLWNWPDFSEIISIKLFLFKSLPGPDAKEEYSQMQSNE